MTSKHTRLALSLGAALGALLAGACSDSDDDPLPAAAAHQDVVLRDHTGQALAPGSTQPYSPRHTCGGCHDIDGISNGYHFQQGRTDMAGNIVVGDDWFADGRDYVRSPGMYGKW